MKTVGYCFSILLLLSSAASAEEEGALLEVRVEGVEASKGGSIRCAVFNEAGASGFPSTPAKAVDRAVFKVSAAENRTQLRVPAKGVYAVSCSHDANDNEKMDTNFLGIPKEGWGVSKGVRPSMRAPRFEEAKFDVTGSPQAVVLRIGY
ncbi:MAG: DUF2141 domain-containing protein [Myxococcota bacterium]